MLLQRKEAKIREVVHKKASLDSSSNPTSDPQNTQEFVFTGMYVNEKMLTARSGLS